MKRTGQACAALALSVGSGTAAMAELHEWTTVAAWDGGADDRFGKSPLIAAGRLVIGASADDNANGLDAGAVYVFDAATLAPIAKLLASDGTISAAFGWRLAADGDRLLVGAPYAESSPGVPSGAAYVFDLATLTEIRKIGPGDGDAGDTFGEAVALDGAIAIVGAPFHLDPFVGTMGAAYLFDVAAGTSLGRVLPAFSPTVDYFGRAVAVRNGAALVGAPYTDADGAANMGTAHLFDVATRQQTGRLVPTDAPTAMYLGSAAAMHGTRALVAARQARNAAGVITGAVFVFDVATRQQVAKLVPSDGTALCGFGYSVATDGAHIVVGTFDEDEPHGGAAYVYDAATFVEIAKLVPSDGVAGDVFGSAVGIHGDTVLVAAPRRDTPAGIDAGIVYVFDLACPGDAVPDRSVDFEDLLLVLACWNQSGGSCATADVDGDGAVGFGDVLTILAHWGPCG